MGANPFSMPSFETWIARLNGGIRLPKRERISRKHHPATKLIWRWFRGPFARFCKASVPLFVQSPGVPASPRQVEWLSKPRVPEGGKDGWLERVKRHRALG